MIYDKNTIDSLLQEPFRGRVKREEPLAAHSSAKAGGPADFFLELESTQEIERLVRLCCQFRVPLLLIGHGSNILFTDQGVRGIVACLRTKGYRLEGPTSLSALAVLDAAMTWSEASEQLAQEGWSGLEFGVGIPGTLAGAVVTNAGAHNKEIGQHLHWVEVLDARGCNLQEEGEFSLPQRRRYTQGELQLGNRKSRFREQQRAQISASGQLVPAPRPLIAPPEIILHLSVTVYRDDKHHIKLREADARASHQLQIDSFAGHIGPLFKDPFGHKASQLIEQAGMKAWSRGKVHVSAHNANFLVNQAGAQASEIASMIVEIHQQVRASFGINLEVDIELYGAWDEGERLR
jgi:UDP-N-acetylmuramate dehydrogenase